MISIENLTVEFGEFVLFDEISFVINKRERIALAGKNGAGKSTLLKILAGHKQPSSGDVSTPKNISVGYLPQELEVQNRLSVFEETMQAFHHFSEIKQQMEQINIQLAERTDYQSKSYHKLIEKSATLSEQYDMLGGNTLSGKVEKTLLGLGFSRADFNRPTENLSGGWRMRVELAKVLLSEPDILLLDEPTNHLDIESITWLENFLINNSFTVVLISHDRAFLDKVTQRTVELSLGKIYDYKVPYTQYIELRKERREQQKKAYENQQKQIRQTEEFIERFRYKATKAVQVQSRIKQLDKLQRIEVDDEDISALNIKFPAAPHSGSYPIIANNISKQYGDKTVIQHVSLSVKRGEKVALVGKNGEGKSTFIKCIMGEIPFEGELKIGHLTKIGYFAQNQAQMLNGEHTVFESIDLVATGDIRTKIRDILGAFMFGGEAAEKKVKVLSGGERSRLAMIKLLLEPVNLLILDEPTNHLDIRSKELLKDALREFDGTVIVVSHDRHFLNNLVDKVYEFSNGHVTEHIGGIYDFLNKKQIENLHELNLNTPQRTSNTQDTPKTDGLLSYEEQKDIARQKKRLERQIKQLEDTIENLENEKSSIENKLASLPTQVNEGIFDRYNEIEQLLNTHLKEWEKLNIQLQNIAE